MGIQQKSNRAATPSRRTFLKRALSAGVAAGVAPMILPSSAWGENAPSNRITLGLVGMGKMMHGHAGWAVGSPQMQAVAMCDVESRRLELQKQRAEERYAKRRGSGSFKGIDTYGDFLEIAARDDIDAVLVATPDHWHVLVSIAMLKSGKDVYCEKPLTKTINEGKVLVDTVRRYGRILQTGSQQRSERGFLHACELVRNGRIGKVKEVWVNIGGPPVECYLPGQPVPETLDWDRWLGPAPWRPYNADIAPSLQLEGAPKNWGQLGEAYASWANFRAYRDYSGGGMTDWGAHHFDIAQWGLGMDGSGPVEVTPPKGAGVEHLTYRYANGVVMKRRGNPDYPKAGVTFIGEEGRVMVGRGYIETDPTSLLRSRIEPGETHLYDSPGHGRDWLNCVKTRSKPICDVEIGHRSASVCHLGNIAYWLNRPLKWDPLKEEFENDAAANRLLSRPMRAPWTLA
jgi:predicted dehydrogenase